MPAAMTRLSAESMLQANRPASERGTILTRGGTPAQEAARAQIKAENVYAAKAGLPLQPMPGASAPVLGLTKGGQAVGAAFFKATDNVSGAMGKVGPGAVAVAAQLGVMKVSVGQNAQAQLAAAKGASTVASVFGAAATSLRAQAGMLKAGFQAPGQVAGLAGRAGGFAGGLASSLANPLMLTMMGGMAAMSVISSIKAKNAERAAAIKTEQTEFGASDVNESVNRYRESIGKAATPAVAVTDVAARSLSVLRRMWQAPPARSPRPSWPGPRAAM